MEKLLDLAQKKADSVEIYSIKNENRNLKIANKVPKDIKYNIQSGVSLMVLKNGKEGFAYTKNLKDRNRLIQNALASLKGNVEGKYRFAKKRNLKNIDNYSNEIEKISSEDLIEEAKRISDILDSNSERESMVNINSSTKKIHILNSNGINYKTKTSNYFSYAGLIFKGSGTGISRAHIGKKFSSMPDSVVNDIKNFYNSAEKKVTGKGGKIDVLFMPNSSITYLWRILSGTNAENLYKHVTPLENEINEKIFSKKLTVLNDPLNDKYSGAREFDDEGVASKKLHVIKNGVFKNYYNNLSLAEKLGMKPTSTGYKKQMWGGDAATLKPSPNLNNLIIKKGNKSLEEMISSMDRGVIVEGALGAHSGNIKNGDFSIGVNPGLYVENGKIVGQLKDAMISGNIYDIFKDIKAIENKLHPAVMGRVPAILCENVSVSS